jgi:DNA polymerase-3 subunit chi
MTRVSFLHGADDRLQAAVAWLGQAAREGRRVLVYAPQESELEHLDRLLWALPATGFTPHCKHGAALATETPVVLTGSLEQPVHDECLLNLSAEVPPAFSRFEHLVEIVSTSDADKVAGRERFRFYRERGYPLEAKDISGEAG